MEKNNFAEKEVFLTLVIKGITYLIYLKTWNFSHNIHDLNFSHNILDPKDRLHVLGIAVFSTLE